jgi:hypothetical protein
MRTRQNCQRKLSLGLYRVCLLQVAGQVYELKIAHIRRMTALCYRNYVVDSRTIAILTNYFQVSSLLRYTHTFSSFPNISLIVRIFHALLKDYSIRAQKSDPIVTTGSLNKHHLSSHRSSFSTLRLRRLLYGQRACPSRTLYGIFIIS